MKLAVVGKTMDREAYLYSLKLVKRVQSQVSNYVPEYRQKEGELALVLSEEAETVLGDDSSVQIVEGDDWDQPEDLDIPKPNFAKLRSFLVGAELEEVFVNVTNPLIALHVMRLEKALEGSDIWGTEKYLKLVLKEATLNPEQLEALKERMYSCNFFFLHVDD